MVVFSSCSNNSNPDDTIRVSEPARYSVKDLFHTLSSGSYPDSLAPLAPNPFNRTIGDSAVNIFFTTKDTGDVRIVIQNPIGDSVAIFRDSILPPGSFIGIWKPVSSSGVRLRPGLYFITMHAGSTDASRNYINSRLLQIQSNE
jgi:hypothetical protein